MHAFLSSSRSRICIRLFEQLGTCFGPLIVGILAGLFASLETASAQQPLQQPNPHAPVLQMPVPLGAQRGSSIDLTLTGSNLAGPTGLWTSFPAKVSFPTDNNNGKDPAKLRVHLEVSHDAPLGFHSIRLATTRGLSNLRMFCIDDLPQVMEVETNHSKATAQAVQVPSVVVGRADQETSDYFKVRVQAGQRVSFEVLGHRLGSGIDPQLTLYDARTGRELPGGHSNDAPGLQTDPRITYVFKEAGEYLVEVRDVMYRGAGDFWYRLRIGDFPCATTPIPMAAQRGSQVTVHFAGPMVAGVAPVEVAVPSDPGVDTIWVTPKGANGLYGWPVSLALSNHEELEEQEPNNDPAHANRLPVPGGITGRFQEGGDIDHYVFAGKKGQRYLIEAKTQELYSPTEVYLVLKDAKGAQLAASNPMAGQRIDFTAPADGDFVLSVEHLLYASGPSETYRVTVTPHEPGFELSLGIDRFDIAPGGVIPVSIFATRRDYGGPIDVSVVGHPDITGHVTIPAGQPAAANVPAAILFVHANPDTPAGPVSIALLGSATIGGRTVVHYANLHTVISKSLANLTYPPHDLLTRVGLGITRKPPFTLTANLDQAEGARGLPVPLTVSVVRSAGFDGEIALSPVGLPANVAAALKNIPKGQQEVKVQLNPAGNAPLGHFAISVTGKAKFENTEFDVTAEPLSLVLGLPFDLHVEPPSLKLTSGGKAKLKVRATRRGGYNGPIALAMRNLPAHVTAGSATIAAGQSAVDIEVTAAADAVAVDKSDVNVLGTATAAANQQNASANFRLKVKAALFDLALEPTAVSLVPGGKTKIKVLARRKGYMGPILLEWRNLPTYVVVPKITLGPGQSMVEVELTASAAALAGAKVDVLVLGTAVAAGNQQIAAPSFALAITKK
ncbi:MAG TPA: hypothetical protein VK395_22705 [Gemmataceae bacterium]|nr:hypothetical protein [Gemmataceae bacterium]